MKNMLLLCITAFLLTCFTACTNYDHEVKTTGDVSTMVQNTPKLDQQKENTNSNSSPKYQTKEFFNVDDLIDWIQTEDIENFQEGRYKNGISSLRKCGKILIPSFDDPDMPSPRIEVMPDNFYPDGYTVIAFFYYLKEKNIVIFVKEMNSSFTKQAETGGISGYLAAQYGTDYAKSPVYKTTIETDDLKINGRLSVEKNKQEISYSIVVDSKTSSNEIAQAYFLSNGFEIKVMQPNNNWEDKYLNDLCLETLTV